MTPPSDGPPGETALQLAKIIAQMAHRVSLHPSVSFRVRHAAGATNQAVKDLFKKVSL